jgi:hypothetical protein
MPAISLSPPKGLIRNLLKLSELFCYAFLMISHRHCGLDPQSLKTKGKETPDQVRRRLLFNTHHCGLDPQSLKKFFQNLYLYGVPPPIFDFTKN